jgi:hypothetical protein
MRWGAVVAVLVLLVVPAVGCGRGGDEVRRASAAGNFTNGRNAAGALATISRQLIRQGRSCAPEVKCQTLGVASAWAQVAAVDVARCGRADAVAARQTMLKLLDAVDAASRGRLREPPPMPPIPNCR